MIWILSLQINLNGIFMCNFAKNKTKNKNGAQKCNQRKLLYLYLTQINKSKKYLHKKGIIYKNLP